MTTFPYQLTSADNVDIYVTAIAKTEFVLNIYNDQRVIIALSRIHPGTYSSSPT